MIMNILYSNVVFIIIFNFISVNPTIDLNAGVLQYLADHLTPEECRTLVAAAHFKSYERPNALDQAGKFYNHKSVN